MHKLPSAAFLAAALLTGCQQPGANLQPNVYHAGQVNQRQDARVVNILAVLPARVEVDNSQNKQTAQIVGGLLGAIGGAAIGSSVGHYHGTNAALGGLAGGATGAVAGSLVPAATLVDGVSLTYVESGHTFNSAQVGKICEFKPGNAVVISTGANETRIQPNETCPAPKT